MFVHESGANFTSKIKALKNLKNLIPWKSITSKPCTVLICDLFCSLIISVESFSQKSVPLNRGNIIFTVTLSLKKKSSCTVTVPRWNLVKKETECRIVLLLPRFGGRKLSILPPALLTGAIGGVIAFQTV